MYAGILMVETKRKTFTYLKKLLVSSLSILKKNIHGPSTSVHIRFSPHGSCTTPS